MKNLLLTLLVVCTIMATSVVSFGQNDNFKQGFTFKAGGLDYYAPYSRFNEDFEFVNGDWREALTYNVEVGYVQNVNKYFNIAVPFKFGTVNLDNIGNTSLVADETNDVWVSIDALGQIKYFKEKQLINPYLLMGVGAAFVGQEELDVQFPLGAGLNIRLADQMFVQLQSEYRFSLDGEEQSRDIMNHTAGFMFLIGEPTAPEIVETPVEVAPVDTDGDGVIDDKDNCPSVAGLAKLSGCPDKDGDNIADKDDACPDVAGIAAFSGCPDTDGDGIADKDDACPNEKGTADRNGCPVKDADSDGVEDGKDACPNEAGPASNNGCPVKDADGDGVVDADDKCPNTKGIAAFNGCPDTDGDGVEDAKDKCPTTAGTVANNGCPEMAKEDKEVLANAGGTIEFQTGKNAIKASSYANMDAVIAIMKKYGDYKLNIGGHTDSVGAAENNQKLSERRAKAVYDYFISKGISADRMSYTGYGETQPIADNKTKDGRQRNRRVEFLAYIR